MANINEKEVFELMKKLALDKKTNTNQVSIINNYVSYHFGKKVSRNNLIKIVLGFIGGVISSFIVFFFII